MGSPRRHLRTAVLVTPMNRAILDQEMAPLAEFRDEIVWVPEGHRESALILILIALGAGPLEGVMRVRG